MTLSRPFPHIGDLRVMSVDTERLRGFDSHKLVDVVRNYRQYGYPPAIRDFALGILRDRGHDIAHLEYTGAFSNHDFTRAEALFESFKTSTLLALLSIC